MAGQGAWGKAGERAHDGGDDIFLYHGHRDFYGAAPVYRRAAPQVYHVGHEVELIIDGGIGGIEPSTIVNCTNGEAEIVRQGKGILNDF